MPYIRSSREVFMAEDVRDNPDEGRFELEIDKQTAFVSYETKAGIITFTHTDVPLVMSGKGVGSRLIRGALDAARERGLKVVAECPFVAAYIKKHGEYGDLLA
jgi:predicted GNAT family acetyltransferase